MFTTHRISIAHLAQVAALFDAYRQFYGKPADLSACTHYLRKRLVADESIVFIAQDSNGTAIGFVQLYPSFSSVSLGKVLILNDLFVSPDWRQKGIARGLITEAIKFARDQGAVRLTLATARTNGTAQRLYESMGWVRDETFYEYTLQV